MKKLVSEITQDDTGTVSISSYLVVNDRRYLLCSLNNAINNEWNVALSTSSASKEYGAAVTLMWVLHERYLAGLEKVGKVVETSLPLESFV